MSLIITSFYSHATSGFKPFKITITGDKEDLRSISRMAELEVAKSTTHCRGPYIPYAKSRWNCSGGKCTRTFGCKRITKNYSRMTLISASRKGVKNSKKIRGEYEIRWPIDKPPTFDTGKAAKKRAAYQKKITEVKRKEKEVKQLKFVKIKEFEKKKKVTLKVRPKTKILEEEALALLEDENLGDYDDILSQKQSKMYEDVTLEDIIPQEKEEFKAKIEKDDAKWKLVTKTAEDGSEKTYDLKKVDGGPPTFKTRWKLANFSLSYKSLSDNQEDKVGTGNLSWAPQFIFNPHWAVKMDLGVQFYTISVVDQVGTTLETTTFPVIPLLVYINYLNDIFFLEAGAGGQFWWEERLGSYFTWSVGFGYRFPVTVPFFDRLFFSYNSVNTQTGIQEFELGLAFRI
jgi:hypothetical protein